MIALDEAFVGIDERYKPDLFGLAVKFDLDLFMTGHDLWVTTGCSRPRAGRWSAPAAT